MRATRRSLLILRRSLGVGRWSWPVTPPPSFCWPSAGRRPAVRRLDPFSLTWRGDRPGSWRRAGPCRGGGILDHPHDHPEAEVGLGYGPERLQGLVPLRVEPGGARVRG